MSSLSTKADRSGINDRELQTLIDLLLIAKDACLLWSTEARLKGAATASAILIERAADADDLIARMTAFDNGDDR